ncbi:MAG: site-2 protease family protein [Pseudomonadota bacterium]
MADAHLDEPSSPLPPQWPAPHPWRLQALLLALTAVTTTLAGVGIAHAIPFSLLDVAREAPYLLPGLVLRQVAADPVLLVDGLGFSLPLLAILLTHEMGHYLTARVYRVPASLPFFIPMPMGLGTMGAVISMRASSHDRRALLDIGASGPLVGFVVAFGVLLLGFARSEVKGPADLAALSALGGVVVEGDSLAYALARWLVHGSLESGADVWIHPTAWAGWVGLYLTWFNLQPFSQFDGGHVATALLGRRAVWLSLAVFIYLPLMFVLTWNAFWLVLTVLMAVMGRFIGYTHPPVVDARPLGLRRTVIAVLCTVLFVATLVPDPWHEAEVPERYKIDAIQPG